MPYLFHQHGNKVEAIKKEDGKKAFEVEGKTPEAALAKAHQVARDREMFDHMHRP